MSKKIDTFLKHNEKFYLSITGLKVRGFWAFPFFAWFAIRSKIQADSAAGMLFSDVSKINGIQHTVTVWESKGAMKKFIYSGVHKKAIKIFKKIATGKTFGFYTNKVPSWSEVHELWKDKGVEY